MTKKSEINITTPPMPIKSIVVSRSKKAAIVNNVAEKNFNSKLIVLIRLNVIPIFFRQFLLDSNGNWIKCFK